ncbi:hypothetical protein [Palleronia sp.]|uniref:hypothetical protein n=1 Tax=Palleronia sp. TaxID=1940284 RepID=UPI0035C7D405
MRLSAVDVGAAERDKLDAREAETSTHGPVWMSPVPSKVDHLIMSLPAPDFRRVQQKIRAIMWFGLLRSRTPEVLGAAR